MKEFLQLIEHGRDKTSLHFIVALQEAYIDEEHVITHQANHVLWINTNRYELLHLILRLDSLQNVYMAS